MEASIRISNRCNFQESHASVGSILTCHRVSYPEDDGFTWFLLAVALLIVDPEALAEYRAQQAQTAAQVPQLPSFDIPSFMAGNKKKSAPGNNRKTK